jgi:hypothetical protein
VQAPTLWLEQAGWDGFDAAWCKDLLIPTRQVELCCRLAIHNTRNNACAHYSTLSAHFTPSPHRMGQQRTQIRKHEHA